jgi:peptidyl-tRNA hydrolase, PTH1 family
MKLIVGLGNPGKEYERTRHNVGWLVIDQLATKLGADWKTKKAWNAMIAESRSNDDKIVLVKPMTFMNRSGDAVARARGFWRKVAVENIWVIHDDADLKLGDIRIKQGGGSAGHRGIKSITEKLCDKNFYRVRVGIGRPANDKMPLDKYVLGKFSEAETKQLDQVIENAIEKILEK